MLDKGALPLTPFPRPYRFVVVTLDSHAAGPAERVLPRLAADFPGLEVSIHAAAEWGANPAARAAAQEAIEEADLVVANLLFLEEHINAVLPQMQAARARADAFVGVIADPQIVRLTRMGDLDMTAPPSALGKLMRKLRGSTDGKPASGERQMALLRRLPKILRFVPGKAQDLRAWFLSMQYWLGGSDDNIEAMIRFLVARYARRPEWRAIRAAEPVDYPDQGLYHPDLADPLHGRITTDPARLPRPSGAHGTVGLLMLRSYILASDTAHYDAVIRELESKGLAVVPAFAGGLDGRPAISAWMQDKVDALISLTGFSLVGGPAYNDSPAAVATLAALDVPYLAAHPLEFQTLGEWAGAAGGLGPVETTMLIALPEIDGATNPTVYGGRHGVAGCSGCPHGCRASTTTHAKAMAPCPERIVQLADKAARLVRLRRGAITNRKVAIVLYGFPPNAGAVGTAAHLSVFESLYNTLQVMATEGYNLIPPASVDDLRAAVLQGNAARFGMPANVAAHVPADRIVADTPWLAEIEATWGPAPGREYSDGRGVFVLGAEFGNVFIGIQPPFGFEGDPMRLLFERGFAPTHAFATFYRWLREDFGADAVLHFGMHGALEFMPGKQAGVGRGCWPDRLIGNLPNIYLYAANNPSEATLAKRRANAITITHMTPPLAQSGLYKGLADLKDSLSRWRGQPPDTPGHVELETMIAEQAAAVDLCGAPAELWLKLLETEAALIPEPTGHTITRSHTGTLWFRLKVRGVPVHVAVAQDGSNAIMSAMHLVNALYAHTRALNAAAKAHPWYAPVPDPIKFNPGIIRGGDWASSTPAWCEVDCRIGLLPGTEVADAMAGVERAVREATAGDTFLANNPPELVWHGFQADGYVLEPGSEAEAVLAAAHAQVHGGSMPERRTTAVNDTRFYGLYFGIPGLCYGPKGEGAHAFDERTSIEDLRRCTLTIAAFIADWCGLKPRAG